MKFAQFSIVLIFVLIHFIIYHQWHKKILADADEAVGILIVCIISFSIWFVILDSAGALSALK